jgi:amino acid transporter
VCFLGAEVRDPQRTIPRAVLGSIVIVGTLYLLMNISVLGVVPWREFTTSTESGPHHVALAAFMLRAYPGAHGAVAAQAIVALIAVAAASSVLALLLGYSRIPFAAARDGNFPAIFGRLHPRLRIPHVSLRVLTGMALFCCLFRLQEVISTLVVIRILFQFLLQGIGVMLRRHRHARRTANGFRMPLFPLPAMLALAGFSFILMSRPHLATEMMPAAVVLVLGAAVYCGRFLRRTKARA